MSKILYAHSEDILPDKVVYLYEQPINLDNPSEIINQIYRGQYVDTISNKLVKVCNSAWVYIPKLELLKDTTRNYILTGHFDNTDLYKFTNGNWSKVAPGGLYMKTSEETQIAGRYSFRLFDCSQDIADGYLVACRRRNDFSTSFMEGKLMSFNELEDWELEIYNSREMYNRVSMLFFGVLSLTTLVLFARYVLSRDKAYLMYAIGNKLFTLVCIVYYYSDALNVKNYPLDDPSIAISLSGPLYILGVASFIQSFKYFYSKIELKCIPTIAAIFCVLLALVNFLLNYYFQFYYYTNIVMYVFLSVLMLVIYTLLYLYRGVLKKYNVTSSFIIILYGSFFLSVCVIIGIVLSIVFENNSNYFGKFYLQSFPLLIGISIYNAFVLVAFSSRDHQLSEEAQELKVKAYEYEMKVLQNSLNPHFIFNSLNLIDFFVYQKDLPQARSVLFRFSDLLRMVIDKTGDKSISLEDELKMLDLYLNLECSRNKNLFKYNIELSKSVDVKNIMIPPLIIQPIVENSVKHGILNLNDQVGNITILIFMSGEFVIIEVKDNGVGFGKSAEMKPTETSDRKHLGLELTRKRLILLSDQSEMEIKDLPEGEGACISIKIPV